MGSDISLSKAVRANLLSLQNTADMMNKTQNRLATGNKVNSALDNPSNFFTASALNSRAADMSNLLDSMASGIKVIEAANNGLTSITKTIESMQSTLRQARQDKTFISDVYEVDENSEITLTGGRFDAGTTIKLRNDDPGIAASLSTSAPFVPPTNTAATTSFSYDDALQGEVIRIGGLNITVDAGVSNAATAAADIQGTLDSIGITDFEVTDDGNGNIVVTTTATGADVAAPIVQLNDAAATRGTATFDFADLQAATTLDIDGTEVVVGGADIEAYSVALSEALGDDFTVEFDAANATVTITNNTPGAASLAPVVEDASGAPITATSEEDGEDGAVVGASQAGTSPTHNFTITYDNKQVNIVVGSGTLEEIGTSINNQLKTAGVNATASFGDDGVLSIEANKAEGKSLNITGASAGLFGTNPTAAGEAPGTVYKATKPVDKFVEEINKQYAGYLRASNDNGKLRIENLSTQELKVSFDKDGAANPLSPIDNTITGNSVRANLSKQFNDLRDQFDKLSDDSSFNGINLLRGDKLKITFNESGSSSIDIQAKDKDGNVRGISAGNLGIVDIEAVDLDTDEQIDALLSTLQTALGELRSQASTFGSNLSSVENRQSFTKNMINTLETGAANLTLADTNEEAANLLALQTRQQLSSSALSMASQQDQAVLQLLR